MKKSIYILFFAFNINYLHAQLYVANAGNDAILCLGDSIQIGGNPIASGGLSPYSATWTPNVNISNQFASNPKVAPTTSMWYYLNVMDANGRNAKDSVYIEIHTQVIPSLTLFPSICFKDDPYFFTEGVPVGGYYTGWGVLDSASIDPFYSGIGSHKITYTYIDSICQLADSVSQNIQVNLNPTILFSPDDTTICKGDTATLMASGASTYNWFPSLGLSYLPPGNIAQAYPDSTISFKVVGTSADQCQDSSNVLVKVIDCGVGIDENAEINGYRLYPNPVNTILFIQDTQSNQKINYQIIDLTSRVLVTGRYVKGIDVSDLPSGTYSLNLLINNTLNKSLVFMIQ